MKMEGYWITPADKPTEVSLYRFTRKFKVSLPATFTASICADTRYRLFLNGKYVCDGPCTGLRNERYYEEPDMTPYLVDGENVITVEVMYIRPEDMILISQLRDNQPALWFNGYIRKNGKKRQIYSFTDWHCEKVNNIHFVSQGFNSMPPVERITGELTGTEVAVERLYRMSFEHNNWNMWGLSDRYLTKPRPIPIMKPAEKKPFTVVKKGENFIELDTGRYTTAVPEMYFKGTKDAKVSFTYAECYILPDNSKNMRDGSINGHIEGVSDEITLTGKEQTFSPFFFRAFRFMRVEWTKGAEFDLDLEKSGFADYFYPLDESGEFQCSNDRYNKIWDISKNTVMCCTHEIIVDCPYYEQQQYGMDSFLEMSFLLKMSNDPRLGKKLIESLASSQLDDGLLQANFPSTMFQVIPSFSLYWVMSIREYLRATGDTAFVRKMTGTIDKVLEGWNSYLTKDGLFGVTNYWHYTDWVPGWEIGVPNGGFTEPLTVYSLIYANVLGIAAELCRDVGRPGLAKEYEMRKKAVNKAVNKHCYDAEAKMYRNTPKTREFSLHTALWAVLSDAITGDAARVLLERALLDDNISKCSFSMNYFVFRALEKTGLYKYAGKVMDGWETMLDKHCTTWCENPGPCRSECHGWSSAPIYEFSAMVLGVFPTENGYKSVRVSPVTEGLDWAKGKVPTPYGDISVSWKKKSGKVVLDVETPADSGIAVNIVYNGKDILTTGENVISCEL